MKRARVSRDHDASLAQDSLERTARELESATEPVSVPSSSSRRSSPCPRPPAPPHLSPRHFSWTDTMQSRTQLLTPSALRLDSRLPLELRSLDFQILPSPPSPSTSSSYAATHPPAKADGYALASHGLTTVSSSVFGPREPQRTGPWSSTGTGQGAGGGIGQAAGGQQKGDRGGVNVEVGVAAWGERVGQGGSSEGGLRRGGKDR